jgi:hypothetical protein
MKIGKKIENKKFTKPMEREFFYEYLKTKDNENYSHIQTKSEKEGNFLDTEAD